MSSSLWHCRVHVRHNSVSVLARGIVPLLAGPSHGTGLKHRTQLNDPSQLCFLTEFLCSKIVEDGIEAAVEVGKCHGHLEEEADGLLHPAAHDHVVPHQALQADPEVHGCEAHQEHHQVDDDYSQGASFFYILFVMGFVIQKNPDGLSRAENHHCKRDQKPKYFHRNDEGSTPCLV